LAGLGQNLSVGGDLYLMGTAITALPEHLTVGGLDLTDTAIRTIPKGVRLGGRNHGMKATTECDQSTPRASVGVFLN